MTDTTLIRHDGPHDLNPAPAPDDAWRMTIWDALATTDPAFTKNFDLAGFQGTAINPTYIARRLTETFGPCGLGWRFVLDREEYRDGHQLDNGTRQIVHVVLGHLEYRLHDDQWHATGPQFGQTTFSGQRNSGVYYTDEEAPKKSITDCLGKCAAQLGMSADIHSGLWDANKYINDPAGRESRVKRQEPPANTAPAGGPAKVSEAASGTVTLPPNFDLWFAEQWAEYFRQHAPSSVELLRIFTAAACRDALYHGEHWAEFCKSVADHLRLVDEKVKTAPGCEIRDELKRQKARLAAAKKGKPTE